MFGLHVFCIFALEINIYDMNHLIAPSLLSADFGHLAQDIEMINRSETDWLHLDIMDGVFVPNISFGFPVLEYVAKYCTKPLDVHLMIVQPEKFLDRFQKLGAMSVNVHYETCTHLNRVIQEIKNLGMKAAVTLNPSTPVSVLEEVIEDVDMVLLMTVNPGFGGQKFIKSSLAKIGRLKKMILEHNSKALIQVDGGVTTKNARALEEAGADVLVAGSAVFGAQDPMEAMKLIRG